MTDIPETRYAGSGDVHIAYQVIGSGPDLLLVPPTFSHLEMRWDDPPYARMLHRLASFSRFISVDRRGGGLSDRVAMPTLEEEVQDLLAVLDEVGSLRSFVFGGGEGGAPDQVGGLSTWRRPRSLRTALAAPPARRAARTHRSDDAREGR